MKRGISMLFVTHNLALVRSIAARVQILDAGPHRRVGPIPLVEVHGLPEGGVPPATLPATVRPDRQPWRAGSAARSLHPSAGGPTDSPVCEFTEPRSLDLGRDADQVHLVDPASAWLWSSTCSPREVGADGPMIPPRARGAGRRTRGAGTSRHQVTCRAKRRVHRCVMPPAVTVGPRSSVLVSSSARLPRWPDPVPAACARRRRSGARKWCSPTRSPHAGPRAGGSDLLTDAARSRGSPLRAGPRQRAWLGRGRRRVPQQALAEASTPTGLLRLGAGTRTGPNSAAVVPVPAGPGPASSPAARSRVSDSGRLRCPGRRRPGAGRGRARGVVRAVRVDATGRYRASMAVGRLAYEAQRAGRSFVTVKPAGFHRPERAAECRAPRRSEAPARPRLACWASRP